jgi:FkbM family methyltransferase
MMSRGLKYLIKSRSLRFVRDLNEKNHEISSIVWNNRKVFYRTSSSDMTLIYEILLKSKYKSEYFFPDELNPKVIFDIGGNIGITSIFLATLFPEAKIYTFEPLPDNFEILKKNIQKYKNIEAFNVGLGSKNGSFKVYLSNDSENFGGISFYPDPVGNNLDTHILCEVQDINSVIEELNLDYIDLIKIDTEGAEYDILTCLKEKIIKKTSWITGELHGNKDFELLTYLNQLGFSLSVKKQIDNRLFMFHAGKVEIITKLRRKDVKAL